VSPFLDHFIRKEMEQQRNMALGRQEGSIETLLFGLLWKIHANGLSLTGQKHATF